MPRTRRAIGATERSRPIDSVIAVHGRRDRLSAALDAYDDRIDRAFDAWTKTALGGSLRAAALSLPHALGLSRASRCRSWREVFRSPVIRSLPFLVAEGHPGARAQIEKLGLAHVLLTFLAFLDDRLNDGQARLTRAGHLVRRSMEAEAQASLAAAIGADPAFWRAVRFQSSRYLRVHADEPTVWSGHARAYDHARYARDAAAKLPVLGWTVRAAVHLGGGSPSELRRLSRIIDHCVIALQYADDVEDWAEDYRSGRWTYFILCHIGASEARGALRPSFAQLSSRIADSTATENFLRRARDHYARALTLIGMLRMPVWQSWLQQRHEDLEKRVRGWRELRHRQRFARALRRVWLAPGRPTPRRTGA